MTRQPYEGRRLARALAVQTLYFTLDEEGKDPQDELPIEEEPILIKGQVIDEAEALDFVLEAGNYPEEDEVHLTKDQSVFYTALVEGVKSHYKEIDQKIEEYLKGWTLERLARIDLTVLRLAFYEIFFAEREDVPAVVAVDEAIEMSKLFSDETSRKFISGVLLNVLNQPKQQES